MVDAAAGSGGGSDSPLWYVLDPLDLRSLGRAKPAEQAAGVRSLYGGVNSADHFALDLRKSFRVKMRLTRHVAPPPPLVLS